MGKVSNLTGQKFGLLRVIERAPRPQHVKPGPAYWRCLCDCGEKHIVQGRALIKGETRSCGCSKNWGVEAAFNRLLNIYKSNAKKRNHVFALLEKDFRKLTKSDCRYCGAPPKKKIVATCGKTYVYNGIDRKNNALGYTKRNCVPSCHRCNYAKNQMTEKQFLTWIKMVYERCYHNR